MIKSQFSYCPSIWMFSSRQSNNLINKVHERSLRLITNNQNSSFETLFQNNKDITFNQKNLQILMTEVYDIVKGEALAIMKNLFIFGENIYNIGNFEIIANENKNTVRYGLENLNKSSSITEWKVTTSNSESTVRKCFVVKHTKKGN